MKNLKTFLFTGLITLFTSTAFAQDPHPDGYEHQIIPWIDQSDNNDSTVRELSETEESNNTFYNSDGCPDSSIQNDWMNYFRREYSFFRNF